MHAVLLFLCVFFAFHHVRFVLIFLLKCNNKGGKSESISDDTKILHEIYVLIFIYFMYVCTFKLIYSVFVYLCIIAFLFIRMLYYCILLGIPFLNTHFDCLYICPPRTYNTQVTLNSFICNG